MGRTPPSKGNSSDSATAAGLSSASARLSASAQASYQGLGSKYPDLLRHAARSQFSQLLNDWLMCSSRVNSICSIASHGSALKLLHSCMWRGLLGQIGCSENGQAQYPLTGRAYCTAMVARVPLQAHPQLAHSWHEAHAVFVQASGFYRDCDAPAGAAVTAGSAAGSSSSRPSTRVKSSPHRPSSEAGAVLPSVADACLDHAACAATMASCSPVRMSHGGWLRCGPAEAWGSHSRAHIPEPRTCRRGCVMRWCHDATEL